MITDKDVRRTLTRMETSEEQIRVCFEMRDYIATQFMPRMNMPPDAIGPLLMQMGLSFLIPFDSQGNQMDRTTVNEELTELFDDLREIINTEIDLRTSGTQ